VTPWSKLHKLIEPFYPKVEGAGRPPIGLARMLRMYVAQQCFGLSDEGIGDAIYDSQAIRAFVGIDLGRESAPDATTLLKFRHLLEAEDLTRQISDAINRHLAEKGSMMREGTIVDATLIAAPPSTNNKDGKRDPEMHQSKKDNDWHFRMKAHIGVDAASGLVPTVVGTAGNVSDVTQAHSLLHGDETTALSDAGYRGVERRPEDVGKAVIWHVAIKHSKRKTLPKNKLGRTTEKLEHLKASVRAKVEPVPCHQEPVPSSEDALPRLGEKHCAAIYIVWLRQLSEMLQKYNSTRHIVC